MTNNEIRKAIGKANRSEIHRRTGISLSGVSRILSGKRNASVRTLLAVAEELKVPALDLYRYLGHLARKGSGDRSRTAA